jgi:DNA-binding NarL/FixJ family response regulator
MRETSVLLVDDHVMFREGIATILEQDKGIRIVGQATAGAEAVALAATYSPDIVILDLSLPDGNGMDWLSRIRAGAPQARFIVLTMHSRRHTIKRAFAEGVHGYVTKDSAGEQLLRAVRSVEAGCSFADENVTQQLARIVSAQGEPTSESDVEGYQTLTIREREVLRHLAAGESSKVVAARLGISRKTVDTHRSNIMRKLNLLEPVDLIRFAARVGVIDIDSWLDG